MAMANWLQNNSFIIQGNTSGNVSQDNSASTTQVILYNIFGYLFAPLTSVPGSHRKALLDTEHMVACICGVGGTIALLMVGLFVLKTWGARALGRSVEFAIENLDYHYLGVEIDIEALAVDGLKGYISMEGMTIGNPPGYSNAYLAKIGQVVLDLDTLPTACSCGKKVVIEKTILQGCDIIVESKLSTSNVQEIVDHLNGDHEAQQEEDTSQKDVPKDVPKQGWFTSCKRGGPEEGDASEKKEIKLKPQEHDETEVVVRKVMLTDISVKVASTALRGAGSYTSIADICFEDLDAEMKEGGKSGGVALVLSIVSKSILKSLMANVVGKETADKQL